MRNAIVKTCLLTLLAGASLSGCGQMGPLALPESATTTAPDAEDGTREDETREDGDER